MPQGRPELHERFGDDGTAFAFLARRGWSQNCGVLMEPLGKSWADIPQDEREAVEYLVTEWDWA